MIIAIDESGDFAPTSARYNYFVAVLLTETNDGLAKKKAQFDAWKSSIPCEKFDAKNEVKGTELTDEELYQFTKQVLLSLPEIHPVSVRIRPNENKEDVQDFFKAVLLELIDKSIAHFQGIGQQEEVIFYQKLKAWYKKRNFQQFMKITTLETVVARALEQAIGLSIAIWALTGSSEDLMHIAIIIDEDFISTATERDYFDATMRQAIRHLTEVHPIPIAREMVEKGHPFVKKYLIGEDRINLSEMLKENMSFLPSNENWQLQIADIYSTIEQRAANKGTCLDSMHLITSSYKKLNRTHYRMNPDPDPTTRIVVIS
jgi:hypothetical protein